MNAMNSHLISSTVNVSTTVDSFTRHFDNYMNDMVFYLILGCSYPIDYARVFRLFRPMWVC